MLPTHNKSNGHYMHQPAFGARIPIVLAFLLGTYLIYQRFWYQDLIKESDSRNYQQQKELAIMRENLYTAKDEINELKKQQFNEAQIKKSLQSKLMLAETASSEANLQLEELEDKIAKLEVKATNMLENNSLELSLMRNSCESELLILTNERDKCASNLKIASTNYAKIEADLQNCVNQNNYLRNNVNQQKSQYNPAQANFAVVPSNNAEQSQNNRDSSVADTQSETNKAGGQSSNLNKNPQANEKNNLLIDSKYSTDSKQAPESKENNKMSEVQAIGGKSNELPPNEKPFHVKPPEEESGEPIENNAAPEIGKKLESKVIEGDAKDESHSEIVDKVNSYLKKNQNEEE